jgi:ribosomal protein S10
MLIDLKVISKNKTSLIFFFKTISKICDKKEFRLIFFLKKFQPRKINRIFTVLKSPHVNKIAQEQFQYHLLSKTIKFYTVQSLKLIVLLRRLQVEFFSDIQIKVYFSIKESNLKRFQNQILNPKVYNLKMFKTQDQTKFLRDIPNKIFLYLRLFDLRGAQLLYMFR